MNFDSTIFTDILKTLEENISFIGDNISNSQDWNFKLDLSVRTIIDKYPGKSNEVKYVIAILEQMEYIKFAINDTSTIVTLTPKGYKFIFKQLHNIDFN